MIIITNLSSLLYFLRSAARGKRWLTCYFSMRIKLLKDDRILGVFQSTNSKIPGPTQKIHKNKVKKKTTNFAFFHDKRKVSKIKILSV